MANAQRNYFRSCSFNFRASNFDFNLSPTSVPSPYYLSKPYHDRRFSPQTP